MDLETISAFVKASRDVDLVKLELALSGEQSDACSFQVYLDEGLAIATLAHKTDAVRPAG